MAEGGPLAETPWLRSLGGDTWAERILWSSPGSSLGALWERSGRALGTSCECAVGVLWELCGSPLGALWDLGVLWELHSKLGQPLVSKNLTFPIVKHQIPTKNLSKINMLEGYPF